ncbi:MAG: flippase-like domain-containing protein [Saprospirales bacterium]|nr:flippase-like domain-containing protein [Saprospirales bacterium]MBK8491593.1 flippase-like domain-containing protein [Saprospirales bacterium]
MITVVANRLRVVFAQKPHPAYIFLLKVALLAALGWAVYHQVWSREDAASLFQTFAGHWAGSGKWLLWTAILLVPLNWGLETQKWRSLLRRFIPISFWQSYRAILAGVAISLFTPNRMGEYGGRVLAVDARHGWKAVLATLVGSMSQWLVLFSMGLLGLALFSSYVAFRNEAILPWLFAGGLVLVSLLAFVFFHLHRLPHWLRRLPFYLYFHRYVRVIAFVHRYRKRDLAKVLGLSVLRYATYSLQYFLLLHFLGVGISPLVGFAGISTLFLFQTSLPLPPVVGLLARGEAALFVWGQFSDQTLSILAASFGLFIINLTIPALLGAIVIVQTNVNKLLGYEKEEVKVDMGGL